MFLNFLFLWLFVCLLFLFCDYSDKVEYNHNYFNQMSPFFTPTSFDSNNTNPAMYNMNQPYRSYWVYLTQYNPYCLSDDQNFKNNFHFHRVNTDSPLPSQIFNHLVHNFHNIHSPIFLPILFFYKTHRRKIWVRKSQSYNQNFQNNFYSSQCSWKFTSLELNFQTSCP